MNKFGMDLSDSSKQTIKKGFPLFPAYQTYSTQLKANEETPTTSGGTNDLSWLSSSSFTPKNNDKVGDASTKTDDPPSPSTESYHSNSSKKSTRKIKRNETVRKKTKNRVKTAYKDEKLFNNDQFFEDRKKEKGNFLVNSLHFPAIPKYNKYNIFFNKLKFYKRKLKKRKLDRYFNISRSDLYSDLKKIEDTFTQTIQDFNKRLNDNPYNIPLWIEYIHFQDNLKEFKTSSSKGSVYEQKLAIVEKAINQNPKSTELLKEKIELLGCMLPSDKLAGEYTEMFNKYPGNVLLWHAVVRAACTNMATCTVPAVLQMYSKALTSVSQSRLHRPAESVEDDILSLFLELGSFLQQANLWEQLCSLIQMYLSVSLTATGKFEVSIQVPEEKLKEKEDIIVTSGLPLCELWLRIEKLRASLHFLPDNNCTSDLQRTVFSDDISGLLEPLVSPESQLHLVVKVIILLKVPLLPTRQCLLGCLGILDMPTVINNAEMLLAAIHNSGTFTSMDCRYMMGVPKLISEPQYVRDQLGQVEFHSWVVGVMQRCAELLATSDSIIIHAWILRWYSLLCRMQSLNICTPQSEIIKKAKSHARQLLKQQQFRENMFLYAEYAMIERDCGNIGKACNILETVASITNLSILSTGNDYSSIYLSRRLVECLLTRDGFPNSKPNVLRVLSAAVEGRTITSVPVSEEGYQALLVKWDQFTGPLVEQFTLQAGHSLTLAAAMTPHLIVESIACHAYLIMFIKSTWQATAFLEQQIQLIPHASNTMGSIWVEQLHELLLELLFRHVTINKTTYGLLRTTLDTAIQKFPNNLNLINILATIEMEKCEMNGGTPIWKLVKLFPPSNPLARFVMILILHCRASDTLRMTENEDLSSTGRNYLINVLRHLIEERTTNRCPMVWRAYLHLSGAISNDTQTKAVFYKCLQAFPWIKDFYLDAVRFLPKELSEIQDLMIEKELRIHIAPDELEILRV